ncbi:exosome complex protein Rrp42 [Candidatus Woesearchaeota archaeon]|nr:exosome complex protein Rrp42 [Candidatus Woesearchaeota archaeon]
MDKELKAHIKEFLAQDKRLDSRKLDEYREPIKVDYGISKTAEGSARVQIGETVVLAGVKLSIEKPYPDTPDQGGIMVNVELLPLSSPEFEPGPPGILAVELSRVVDRGIREAKAIDVKKLCIEKGEKAWTVSIDICPINDAGNLFDAAGLAALAALKDAKFPKYENDEIDYKTRTNKKLPLSQEPIPVTIIKIGSKFLVDPTGQEEKVFDARLTVSTTPDGTISALQKGGDETLTITEIDDMVKIALEKGKFLREKL